MGAIDPDVILDRILITAIFSTLSQNSQLKTLSSIHSLIDHNYAFQSEGLKPDELAELQEHLRTLLTMRLPKSLLYSRQYLLDNY
ncbi:hypothetical protein S922_16020 [Salmonella enterica subsp. enterica]|nr:hypothetical protein [Salmonella enterica subsp. enterica]